jgi:hypothetical protein
VEATVVVGSVTVVDSKDVPNVRPCGVALSVISISIIAPFVVVPLRFVDIEVIAVASPVIS